MNKKVIIILVNILVGIALLFVFADPLWNSIKVLRAEIDKQNEEISKVEELLVKVQELEAEYQETGGEAIEGILEALPEEKDLPYLINQFEAMAVNNGLLMESIKFSEDIKSDKKSTQQSSQMDEFSASSNSDSQEVISPFPYLTVEMTLSGSYEGFKTYLEDLESNIRLMDIKDVDFASEQSKDSEGESSGLPIFKFNMGLLVYYQ